MKLEEVLPAMREGRVALWSDIRYSVQGAGVCVWDYMNKRWTDCHALATDGWTLEPEPKVEWPKGSLQWAELQAGDGGSVTRSGRRWYFACGEDRPSNTWDDLNHDDRHALDWEVVP